MFNSLKKVLITVALQIAETKYSRLLIVAGVVIPLVLLMYGYIDDVLLNARNALNDISSYSISNGSRTFPVGAYTISYLNVAQFDTCLKTIFTYMTTAIVWSFTTDLKPAFTRK
jgi:hypothetical protein